MHRRIRTTRLGLFGAAALTLGVGAVLIAATGGDCWLTFDGWYRESVKNRKPGQTGYTSYNGGSPITVPEWFQLMTQLNGALPARPTYTSPTVAGIETIQVRLAGYLVALKWDYDNDLHCELAAGPQWNTDHVIVEVPPGNAYCTARKLLWGYAKTESVQAGKTLNRTWVFLNPVWINVTGYVFLDAASAPSGTRDFTSPPGSQTGRGIVGPDGTRWARGYWELHPVTGAS